MTDKFQGGKSCPHGWALGLGKCGKGEKCPVYQINDIAVKSCTIIVLYSIIKYLAV